MIFFVKIMLFQKLQHELQTYDVDVEAGVGKVEEDVAVGVD